LSQFIRRLWLTGTVNIWTFVRISFKTNSEEAARKLAEDQLAKVRIELAAVPAKREQFAAHGQTHLNQLPMAILMVPVAMGGLAGNLLASCIGHFIDRRVAFNHGFLGWQQADWIWAGVGVVSLLVFVQLVRLAQSLYHYNLAMGIAYGLAIGGKIE